MSFTKKINVNDGSGRKFEEQTTAEMPLDVTPQLGSFNAVTSDGVARAVAGASGEVPQVTENDNGKVLKAIYDAGGPAVEWGEAQGGVPEYSATDEGKVLGVVTEGVEDTPALGWVEQQGGTVDQTYDATSANAQSGVAVAGAIAGVNAVPASTASDENKVLTVNASGSPVWATAQGGGGMLPPIADNTVRCRFAAGYTPAMGTDGNVCVDVANNIWDITDNTEFANKFSNNTNLLEVLGARLTTISSRSCSNMFGSCTSLTKAVGLYLSSEGGSYSDYTADYMFSGCSALRKVEFTKMDVSSADHMFYGCSKLEDHLGLDSSALANTAYMFCNCYALRVGYMGDTSSITNMQCMYHGCRSLVQVQPEVVISMVANGSILNDAFYGCSSLESLPKISGYTFLLDQLNLSGVFQGCSNAVNGIKKAYDFLSGISPISSTTDCFTGCGTNSYSGQQERAQIPAAWGGTGA